MKQQMTRVLAGLVLAQHAVTALDLAPLLDGSPLPGGCSALCAPEYDRRRQSEFLFAPAATPENVTVGGVAIADGGDGPSAAAAARLVVVDDRRGEPVEPLALIFLGSPTPAVDCSAVTAVALARNAAALPDARVFATRLERGATSNVCVAAWRGAFASAEHMDPSRDFVVAFVLGDALGDAGTVTPSSASVVVQPLDQRIVTADELARKLFVLSDLRTLEDEDSDPDAPITSRVFKTVVQLDRDSLTPSSCGFPTSMVVHLDGKLEGGDADCAVTTGAPVQAEDGQSVEYAATHDFDRVVACARSATTTGGDSVFWMVVQAEARPEALEGEGCGAGDWVPLDPSRAPQEYHVAVSNTVTAGSEEVTQLLVQYVDQAPLACAGRTTPMARLEVRAQMITTFPNFADIQRSYPAAAVDEAAMTRVAGPQCEDEGRDCEVAFASEACLPMEFLDDGGCRFARRGQLNISVTYTYLDDQDNVIIAETAALDRLVVPEKVFPASQCPTVLEQENVTSSFPINMDIDGPNNLNNEMTTRVFFADGFDASEVTLRILSVEAELRSSSSSGSSDPDFEKRFEVETKLALLNYAEAAEYSDAHFCRYRASGEDVCRPFYLASAGRVNDLVLADPDRFLSPTRGYEGCQRNDQRREDRFIFTPSNWVFSEFDEADGEMVFFVKAEVTTCATPASSQRRQLRVLQQSGGGDDEDDDEDVVVGDRGPVKVTSARISVPIKMVNEDGLQGNVPPPGGEPVDTAAFPVAAVAAAAVACGLVVLVAAVAIHRRRSGGAAGAAKASSTSARVEGQLAA